MSVGSVCVSFSYVIVVGDVLDLFFSDMIELSIRACSFGSFCASSSLLVMCSFFFCVIVFLRLFLAVLCALIFFVVGCLILVLWSSC